jgi:hypothetical protein
LDNSINTIKENTETLLEASRYVGLEINAEKTKYMIACFHPNPRQNQNIRIANESFENVAKFKYLRVILTNQNDIHDEIKSRLNSGNACCYSVKKFLSSWLITKNLKIKIYNTVMVPVVLYGCEIWSLTLREEHRQQRTVCGEGYLDLKGRKTDRGENCIMMNFTACILH